MASRSLLRPGHMRWIRWLGDAVPGTLPRLPPAARLHSRAADDAVGLRSLINHNHKASSTCSIIRPGNHPASCAISHRDTRRRFSQPSHRRDSAARPGGERGEQAYNHRKPGRSSKASLLTATFAAAAGLTTWHTIEWEAGPSALNTERFSPFVVASTEQVSPTSFIVTLKQPGLHGSAAVIRRAWGHGLWSVEVKQPQLQIARHYTPLPTARSGEPEEEEGEATLRLLVRRYDKGELSTYLSRLREGDTVELRGPHLGFDLAGLLGSAGAHLVFLAGGTGIAPALQAARRLASLRGEGEGEDLSVDILWANRSRADCAGCPRLRSVGDGRTWWQRFLLLLSVSADEQQQQQQQQQHIDGEPAVPVVQQLRDLQKEYREKGHALELRCVVDEEGSAIGARDIMEAVARPLSSGPPAPARTPAYVAPSCRLHSRRQLESDTGHDGEGAKGVKVEARQCTCARAGNDLFMISGPDGFVGQYAGPKLWTAGAEQQGPVSGVVGELIRKDPKIWREWLVLKQ